MGPTTTLHHSPQCLEVCGFCRKKERKKVKSSSVEVGSHQPVLVREVLMDIFFEREEPLQAEWSPYNFAWQAISWSASMISVERLHNWCIPLSVLEL